MKIDRVADIPIRHRFVDYVCSIGYSEQGEEFVLVSARYADLTRAKVPSNAFNLYLRILKEPALRATMLEALAPDCVSQIHDLREQAISERGSNVGFSAGFIAFLILGYALYKLTFLLAKFMGHDWAGMITYIPMFFACLVILPVQGHVERWYARRYCDQHSHNLYSLSHRDGLEITRCKRCGLVFHRTKS